MSLSNEAQTFLLLSLDKTKTKTNNKQTKKPVQPGANPFSTLIVIQMSL